MGDGILVVKLDWTANIFSLSTKQYEIKERKKNNNNSTHHDTTDACEGGLSGSYRYVSLSTQQYEESLTKKSKKKKQSTQNNITDARMPRRLSFICGSGSIFGMKRWPHPAPCSGSLQHLFLLLHKLFVCFNNFTPMVLISFPNLLKDFIPSSSGSEDYKN